MPDCSTGAVSMKITSSTSTTSTSGVMLMSDRELWVRPLLLVKATSGLPCFRLGIGALHGHLFHAVDQLAGKIVQTRTHIPDPGGELVISHHRRHGHNQTGSRGNQRLRDTGSHCTERRCTGCAQPMKGIYNAHDGAKQSNEGRNRSNRRQP